MAKLIFAAAITLLLSALLVDAATVTETTCTETANCTITFTNSDCDTTAGKCTCATTYELTNEDKECKLSAGQACTKNDDCASNDCDGSTGTDLCSGAPVAVTASIVLMFFTFLTSRFF